MNNTFRLKELYAVLLDDIACIEEYKTDYSLLKKMHRWIASYLVKKAYNIAENTALENMCNLLSLTDLADLADEWANKENKITEKFEARRKFYSLIGLEILITNHPQPFSEIRKIVKKKYAQLFSKKQS